MSYSPFRRAFGLLDTFLLYSHFTVCCGYVHLLLTHMRRTRGDKHVEGAAIHLPEPGMRLRDGGDQSASGRRRFESAMRMWERNEETIR
jgi:hypothetical protein